MWEFIKFTIQTLNVQWSERFTDHQRVHLQQKSQMLRPTSWTGYRGCCLHLSAGSWHHRSLTKTTCSLLKGHSFYCHWGHPWQGIFVDVHISIIPECNRCNNTTILLFFKFTTIIYECFYQFISPSPTGWALIVTGAWHSRKIDFWDDPLSLLRQQHMEHNDHHDCSTET